MDAMGSTGSSLVGLHHRVHRESAHFISSVKGLVTKRGLPVSMLSISVSAIGASVVDIILMLLLTLLLM
jgi:hypothetical protein